uniref:Putative glucose dehydrogenase fad quinone n=1 Tax=Panstrongylus lignarius TaxID=156445 RepID=A0A224XMC3_9HEMI
MLNLASLLAILASMLAMFWPEELDPLLKPRDSSSLLNSSHYINFDFIIVGAGSAGSVVANRLSAHWKVLLIEAGGPEDYYTDTPALAPTLIASKYDWNYTTTKQPHSCLNNGGYCFVSRGRVSGGSSTINGMVYCRGNPQDYQKWEEMGNPGWNYSCVLPYFLKSENSTIGTSSYHSNAGELSVSYPNFKYPITEDFIQAGREYGLPLTDYNGPNQIGVSYTQYNMREGVVRCSSSKAFLDPIRNRPNLYIFMNTLVVKVLFSEEPTRRAVGVTCVRAGRHYDVFANKDVIISAGALDTPKLLLLSGIGPRLHLQEMGISVVADLPVGNNLVDHVGVFMTFKLNTTYIDCCGEFTNRTVERYARDKTGELTAYLYQVQMFLPSGRRPTAGTSTELSIGLDKVNNSAGEGPNALILVGVTKPESVGQIRLKSKNYKDQQLINPNHFSKKIDIENLMEGMKQTLEIFRTKALKKYSPRWIVDDVPQCLPYYTEPITNQFLECYMKYQGKVTVTNHQVGTARMGNSSSNSVVDHELRVYGIKNLRIIDASIMPEIISCNTNAPCVMIGEKGSDYIINTYQ